MKKIIFLTLALTYHASAFSACTPEQFKEEYKEFYSAQTLYKKTKIHELDALLKKLGKEKNLSRKEIYDYRINLLNDAKALKIKKWEPSLSVRDIFTLESEGKCGRLMKYHKKLSKSADKQWKIIFDKATADLNK